MKKAIYTLTVFLTLAILESCCCVQGMPVCETKVIEDITNIGPNIDISQTEFIVTLTEKFEEVSDTLAVVEGFVKAIFDEVLVPDYCRCGDKTRIRFTSESPILDIETKVGGLGGGSGGHVEGDIQFSFTLSPEIGQIALQNKLDDFDEFIHGRSSRIIIAVIDTGMDLSKFNPGILYPNPDGVGCGVGASGWNFVDHDEDIQDDHNGVGHGTLVTKLISSQLEKEGISHQILPLKVFDAKGKGNYWNLVCAMDFLNQVQDNSDDAIAIVNASFGGSLGILEEGSTHSLKREIDRLRETAIVVTSAGNCNFNTDSRFFRHYPSGYSSKNILAVGGYEIKDNEVVVHNSSNYGRKNIDLATPYDQKLIITLNDGSILEEDLSGTSYSAAYTTFLLAKHIKEKGIFPIDAPQVRSDFLSTASTQSGHFSRCINKGRFMK